MCVRTIILTLSCYFLLILPDMTWNIIDIPVVDSGAEIWLLCVCVCACVCITLNEKLCELRNHHCFLSFQKYNEKLSVWSFCKKSWRKWLNIDIVKTWLMLHFGHEVCENNSWRWDILLHVLMVSFLIRIGDGSESPSFRPIWSLDVFPPLTYYLKTHTTHTHTRARARARVRTQIYILVTKLCCHLLTDCFSSYKKCIFNTRMSFWKCCIITRNIVRRNCFSQYPQTCRKYGIFWSKTRICDNLEIF